MTTNVIGLTGSIGITCNYGSCDNQLFVDAGTLRASGQMNEVEKIFFLNEGDYTSTVKSIELPQVASTCVGTHVIELIDGSMVLSDGTSIAISNDPSSLQAFGVTLFEDELRIEVYSQNNELAEANLYLNIKSKMTEYPDWYDTTEVKVNYLYYSCVLL